MTSSFSGLAAFSSLGFGGFLHCIHERGRERERERESGEEVGWKTISDGQRRRQVTLNFKERRDGGREGKRVYIDREVLTGASCPSSP